MDWLEDGLGNSSNNNGSRLKQSTGGINDDNNSGSNKKKRMLGAEATVHIQRELSSKQPNKVISEFQKYHSLDLFTSSASSSASSSSDAVAASSSSTTKRRRTDGEEVELWGLLGMLELMGLTKADVNISLLGCLRNSLLFQIENNLSVNKLYELLEETFMWINFEELRPLVMSIMRKLPSISITYLKQLCATPTPSYFNELPIEVKRQIWLLDDSFLTSHFVPLIHRYLCFYSATSVTPNLLASSSLSLSSSSSFHTSVALADPLPSSSLSPPPSPPHSPTVLSPTIEVMSTASAFTFPPMLSPDPLHTPTPQKRREKNVALQEIVKAIGREVEVYNKFLQLVKSSAFKDSSSKNERLGDQRICTLRTDVLMALHDAGIAEIYEKDECHEFGWVMDACVRDNNVELRRIKEMQSFFEHISASASGLTDPAMIVADPYATNTLIRNIYSALQQVVRKEIIPKDDEGLRYMTQLLALSYEAPSSTQNKNQKPFFKFPKSQKEILHLFYPLLASRILDHEAPSSSSDKPSSAILPIEQSLRDLFHTNVIARKVVLYYVLVRFQADDLETTQLFLPLVFELKEKILEEPSFSQSLLLLLLGTTIPTTNAQHIRQMILDNIVPLNSLSSELHLQLIQFIAASHTRLPSQQLFSLMQKLVSGAHQFFSDKLLPEYDQKRLGIAYRHLVDRLSSRVNERNAPFLFDLLSLISSHPTTSTIDPT